MLNISHLIDEEEWSFVFLASRYIGSPMKVTGGSGREYSIQYYPIGDWVHIDDLEEVVTLKKERWCSQKQCTIEETPIKSVPPTMEALKNKPKM